MSEATVQAQAELMAAGMQVKVMERAQSMVAAEMADDPPFTTDEQEVLNVGILSGFLQTIVVLQEMGLLPTSPAVSS